MISSLGREARLLLFLQAILLVVGHGRDDLSRVTTGVLMLRVQLHFHFRALFPSTSQERSTRANEDRHFTFRRVRTSRIVRRYPRDSVRPGPLLKACYSLTC